MVLYIAVIIALLIFMFMQQIIHHIERKDLYNRIMAQDLTDYKQKPVKHRSVSCAIRKNNDERRDNDK